MYEVAAMQSEITRSNPTCVGYVWSGPEDGQGVQVSMFEHPLYGDEAPLLVLWEGIYYSTPFWELESVDADEIATVLGA